MADLTIEQVDAALAKARERGDKASLRPCES